MKRIKVVFTRTRGIFPFFIRLVTRSYFNHVYIMYPNGYCLEADKREGVVVRHYSTQRWNDIISAEHVSIDVDDKAFAEATYDSILRCTDKYDWKGIVGCLFGLKFFYDEDREYCSKLSTTFLTHAKVLPSIFRHRNITPHQLYQLLHKRKGTI